MVAQESALTLTVESQPAVAISRGASLVAPQVWSGEHMFVSRRAAPYKPPHSKTLDAVMKEFNKGHSSCY